MLDTIVTIEPEEYCRTSDAARILRMSIVTVQKLVEKNELKAWKTQGGHRRILISSIRDYQLKNGIDISPDLPSSAKLEVSVVSDDREISELIAMAEAHSNTSVRHTINPSLFETLMNITNPRPDVLIVNLNMTHPVMKDFLRTISKTNKLRDLWILVASSFTQEEIDEHLSKIDGVMFWNRPINPAWLGGFFSAIAAKKQKSARTNHRVSDFSSDSHNFPGRVTSSMSIPPSKSPSLSNAM